MGFQFKSAAVIHGASLPLIDGLHYPPLDEGTEVNDLSLCAISERFYQYEDPAWNYSGSRPYGVDRYPPLTWRIQQPGLAQYPGIVPILPRPILSGTVVWQLAAPDFPNQIYPWEKGIEIVQDDTTTIDVGLWPYYITANWSADAEEELSLVWGESEAMASLPLRHPGAICSAVYVSATKKAEESFPDSGPLILGVEGGEVLAETPRVDEQFVVDATTVELHDGEYQPWSVWVQSFGLPPFDKLHTCYAPNHLGPRSPQYWAFEGYHPPGWPWPFVVYVDTEWFPGLIRADLYTVYFGRATIKYGFGTYSGKTYQMALVNGDVLKLSETAQNVEWHSLVYTRPVLNVVRSPFGSTFVSTENRFYRSNGVGHDYEIFAPPFWDPQHTLYRQPNVYTLYRQPNGLLIAVAANGDRAASEDEGETWHTLAG